ncbi:hypothetical protein QFC22_001152 [Naganishia vaughanmartiniae]|uniref:Uncharacterized protein n=1 Tax=Naganishia vaughanmartiniae TaxID=1424756 RepID=A0ACC2XNS6_9TREE|nr:hypothetical protein QFC22_001152 [Naganishia vaughanmartiniae]
MPQQGSTFAGSGEEGHTGEPREDLQEEGRIQGCDLQGGHNEEESGAAASPTRVDPTTNTNSSAKHADLPPAPVSVQPAKQPISRTTYYTARKPIDLPASLAERGIEVGDIDYDNLPKRTDQSVKESVNSIIAPGISGAESDRRATKTGSIDFPKSFPADAMHLLLENVGKGLLDLWSGTYKAQTIRGNAKSKSAELYVLPKSAWDRMDAAVVASGKLIPTAISGTLPSVSKRWRWTAETHLFFITTLGPIILKGNLSEPYYRHFVEFSELVKKLIALTMNLETELPLVESGLKKWVVDYDQ